MATLLDHYELLGLSEKRNEQAISPDELRQAYKRALLTHHPDKKSAVLPLSSTAAATVDEITEAYRVLGDARLRAQYDHVLRRTGTARSADGSTRHTGMETIDLEELSEDEDSAVWRRPCRCGSEPAFVITEAELEKNIEYGELITGCKGCSLWLKVMFTVED